MAPSMECVWVEVTADGKIRSTHRLALGSHKTGAEVFFGQDSQSKGQWTYINPPGWAGFILVEFAASRKDIPKRRHALQQNGPNEFLLMPPNHPMYKESLWSSKSVPHFNENRIMMIVIAIERLWGDMKMSDKSDKSVSDKSDKSGNAGSDTYS